MKKIVSFCAVLLFVFAAVGYFALSDVPVFAGVKDGSSASVGVVTETDGLLQRFRSYMGGADYPTYEGEEVYLGGTPIGLEMQGAVRVRNLMTVVTQEGAVVPTRDKDIAIGDEIVSVNGVEVVTPRELAREIDKGKDGVVLVIRRGTETLEIELVPAKDSLTGRYRLGIEVDAGTAGVGTLTYVRKNGEFGALGHRVSGEEKGENTGLVFPAVISGVNKAEKGKAGALVGTFMPTRPFGEITKNTGVGVYGRWLANPPQTRVYVGGRAAVTVGSAKIYTTVEGRFPDFYDVEILKIYDQNSPQEKSFIISVTDADLLAATGGIVQGMSGSPIIQNDRLVGAVTHVIVNEPTKGYGIFVDWMIATGEGSSELARLPQAS